MAPFNLFSLLACLKHRYGLFIELRRKIWFYWLYEKHWFFTEISHSLWHHCLYYKMFLYNKKQRYRQTKIDKMVKLHLVYVLITTVTVFDVNYVVSGPVVQTVRCLISALHFNLFFTWPFVHSLFRSSFAYLQSQLPTLLFYIWWTGLCSQLT